MGERLEKIKGALKKAAGWLSRKVKGTEEEPGLWERFWASVGYYPSNPKELEKLQKYYEMQARVKAVKGFAKQLEKLQKEGCIIDPYSGAITCPRPMYTTTGIMPLATSSSPSRGRITIKETYYEPGPGGERRVVKVVEKSYPAKWIMNPASRQALAGIQELPRAPVYYITPVIGGGRTPTRIIQVIPTPVAQPAAHPYPYPAPQAYYRYYSPAYNVYRPFNVLQMHLNYLNSYIRRLNTMWG